MTSRFLSARRRRGVGPVVLAVLVLAGCGGGGPTLDERIDDLDAAIELYKTVDGARCESPTSPNSEGSTLAVRCEDNALIVWDEEDRDENTRDMLAAMLSDNGEDAVVGVNVTIMNVDRETVAEQIDGVHP